MLLFSIPLHTYLKNVSKSHLDTFYKTFNEIKHRRFDGMIITGAPVERMEFEDVHYWNEITEIMDWVKNQCNVLYVYLLGSPSSTLSPFWYRKIRTS